MQFFNFAGEISMQAHVSWSVEIFHGIHEEPLCVNLSSLPDLPSFTIDVVMWCGDIVSVSEVIFLLWLLFSSFVSNFSLSSFCSTCKQNCGSEFLHPFNFFFRQSSSFFFIKYFLCLLQFVSQLV